MNILFPAGMFLTAVNQLGFVPSTANQNLSRQFRKNKIVYFDYLSVLLTLSFAQL